MQRAAEPTPRLIQLERQCAQCEHALVAALQLDNARLLSIVSNRLLAARARFEHLARQCGYPILRISDAAVPSEPRRDQLVREHSAWSAQYAKRNDVERVRLRLRGGLPDALALVSRGFAHSARRVRAPVEEHAPSLEATDAQLLREERRLSRAAERHAATGLVRSSVEALQSASRSYKRALRAFSAAAEIAVPVVERPRHYARAQREGTRVLQSWLVMAERSAPSERVRLRTSELYREVSKHGLCFAHLATFAIRRVQSRELQLQLALHRLEHEHALLCQHIARAALDLDGTPSHQQTYDELLRLEAAHVRAMTPVVQELGLAPQHASPRERCERGHIELALAWSHVPVAQRRFVAGGADERALLAGRYYRSIVERGSKEHVLCR